MKIVAARNLGVLNQVWEFHTRQMILVHQLLRIHSCNYTTPTQNLMPVLICPGHAVNT